MKTKIKYKENETKFPKLMISPNNLIVLFTEPEIGTVVFCQHGFHNIGTYEENWLMQNFKDFDGIVELSN